MIKILPSTTLDSSPAPPSISFAMSFSPPRPVFRCPARCYRPYRVEAAAAACTAHSPSPKHGSITPCLCDRGLLNITMAWIRGRRGCHSTCRHARSQSPDHVQVTSPAGVRALELHRGRHAPLTLDFLPSKPTAASPVLFAASVTLHALCSPIHGCKFRF